METKEPKSWAGAMLKHVREQQRLKIETAESVKPESKITFRQLIEILAILGEYDVSIIRKNI